MARIVNYSIQLLAIFLLFGCGGTTPVPKAPPKQVDSPPLTVNAVNIYLENSASMDGYLPKGEDSNFRRAISRLSVMLLNHYEGKVSVKFINNKIDEIDSLSREKIDLKNLARDLPRLWDMGAELRRKNPAAADTELHKIYEEILSRTDDQTISILFSDCIPSAGGGGVLAALAIQRDLTLATFNNILRRGEFTTTILKMTSHFNGRYFPYTGDRNVFTVNMERPYYLVIVANRHIMNDFNGKSGLNLEALDGYSDKYVLSSEEPTGIYYTALMATGMEGRFRQGREYNNRTINYVRGITGVEPPRNGTLSFSVAVDFSRLPVGNDYLLNPDNYVVTTNNFDIEDIKPIGAIDIKPVDKAKIDVDRLTHVIRLRAKTRAANNVDFALKKQMPEWIEVFNSEDDTRRENLINKTFGLKYWVEGIAKSYEVQYPGNENYFVGRITIGR